MKKILITGKGSYIGTSFKNYLENNHPNEYLVDEINVKKPIWKELDFSKYDVVFHVAGIAHIKETKDNEELYYKVNRDLALEVANKANREKVKQFIFMSSMSVYGIDEGKIYKSTKTNPKSAYGRSKLQAETGIYKLQSNKFSVAIIRPPMVYGPSCKGNYQKLAKFAVRTPIFPKINNKRSMIFVDNLSLFVKELIDNKCKGVYLPQNEEYVNTSEMIKEISEVNGNNVHFIGLFNPIIRLLTNISVINKVFGDLYYEQYANSFKQISFKESIKISEGSRNYHE